MKKLLPYLFILTTLVAQTQQELFELQKDAFKQYKQKQLDGLQKYIQAQNKAYEELKTTINFLVHLQP